ncbi:MAG: hypothetical protein JNN11_03810 [Candidatus Doudnabacteria bacterium]|nr:hypothetical protein [Candidatus Doudnabacteria bacterium]
MLVLLALVTTIFAAEPTQKNLDASPGFVWGYIAREVSWITRSESGYLELVRADLVCTDKTERRCAALRQYLIPLPKTNYMIFTKKDFPLGSPKQPRDENPARLVSPGVVIPLLQKLQQEPGHSNQ